jgi:hypothetical protein
VLPRGRTRVLLSLRVLTEEHPQFFLNLGMLIATYYLPLWYQSTKGATATKSGLDILPLMISLVVAAAGSGVLLSVR